MRLTSSMRPQVLHVDEFAKLSDLELLQLVEQEMRKLLLEDHSHGGTGDAGEEGGEGSAEG